jgi:predicted phage terminase large subunit-like protein
VVWPAWEWIERPETAWIYASYDAGLVGRDADKMIKLLASPWFLERWGPKVRTDRKLAVQDFGNERGGFRYSTSVGGGVTGRHADIQVVDDPIKPKDAAGGSNQSRAMLEACSTWYRETMATRVRNPKTSRRVLIMQRLHEEDLAAECIASGYVHLRLPMRHETDDPCRTPWGGDRRTKEGELLFPARFPEEEVQTLEVELGPDGTAAQLQQSPKTKGGGIIKESWWRYWHPTDPDLGVPLPDVAFQLLSWDLTFKGTDQSDMVAGGAWLQAADRYFLTDVVYEQLDIVQTLQAIRYLKGRYPDAREILVEDKANGPAVERLLRDEIPGIELVNPEGGKVSRLNAVAPLFAAGKVYIPHPSLSDRYPWIRTYQKNVQAFPKVKRDDLVDMTSQALFRLKRYGATFSDAMKRIRGES